jgi:hypothetical protein
MNQEERAIIINLLLLPASKQTTLEDEARNYQHAYSFVINQILSGQDEQSDSMRQLLNSYLATADCYLRPFLLTALLSAHQQTGRDNKVSKLLPKIAESLGAFGVKIGQAAHSYPGTPEEYRHELKTLKSQSRIPHRWELWLLLEKSLPKDLFENMKLVHEILGGASFYIAVRVTLLSGETRVLRVLRDNIKRETEYGMAHCDRALAHCEYPPIVEIKPALTQILAYAKDSYQAEINVQTANMQYCIATNFYNETIKVSIVNKKTFKVQTQAVRVYNVHPCVQEIDLAEGEEFNTLITHPKGQELAWAVAYTVIYSELKRMISGQPFDADRHGGQLRARLLGSDHILITHYDFGELVIDKPTENELKHCAACFDLIYKNLLSGYFSGHFSLEAMINIVNDYLNDPMHSKDDLRRLQAIRKGILALQDYFSYLSKPEYSMVLRQLAMDLGFLMTKQKVFSMFNFFKDTVSSFLDSASYSTNPEPPHP